MYVRPILISGLGDFLGGLKLPELPLPKLPEFPKLPNIFGGSEEKAKAKSDGQAIPINLGIKPYSDVSLAAKI